MPEPEVSEQSTVPSIAYPVTVMEPVTETFESATDGQVTVTDAYRWLEDDVRESEAVAGWVAAQNQVTRKYLDALPGRSRIAARLEELFDYARYSLPVKRGDHYFYSVNDGLQDQAVYQVLTDLASEPRDLLDPNGWSDDGTVAFATTQPSPDGSKVAYLVQDGGSDWRTARVVDVATGETLSDQIDWIKFSGLSWAKDNSGFYYSRYPQPPADEVFSAPNLNQAVYFHRLETGQSEDRLIASDPEQPDVGWDAEVADDGDYLVLNSWRGTDGGGVQILDLRQADAQPIQVFEGFDYNHSYVGNRGSTFWFLTDLDAPNKRVVAVDLEDPTTRRDLIAEGDQPIEAVSFVGNQLLVTRLVDVATQVTRYDTEDFKVLGTVDLPGLGTAGGFRGSPDDPETFYAFTSFNRPTTQYRLNVADGTSEVFRAPALKFNPDDYRVEQVFFSSTDDVRVPMFIVHHKDLKPDNGPHPTLLYGYGGFGASLTPYFSSSRLAWMELGGVFVLANLRGGSEYGRAWHDGGRLKNKQNVFDDFINAAETLIASGWASPETLAMQGGSNGGLLVGAVANQRPDLFAAALPAVGVMDMTRFHRFTAGRFWVDDYGSPDDPEMFDVIRAYSPYHNVPAGQDYPATLITTADTDDRVVPGHSFKFAAQLQATATGSKPTLIRVETRAGHGAGTPISKIVEETADEWAFLAKHTGLSLDD
ncbi:MAG: prolyl oligopeptidase family serine peptidase [Pseudomonadota bacterium]